MRVATLLLLSLGGLGLATYPGSFADEPTLSAATSVYDPRNRLVPELKQALEAISIEQLTAGGQRLMLAVFDQAEGGSPEDTARRYFDRSRQVDAGLLVHGSKDQRILVALFWSEKEVVVETGLGLDALVSRDTLQGIADEQLAPRLKGGGVATGIIRTYLGILRAIESPLVPSQKAEQIFNAWSIEGAAAPAPVSWTWLFVIFASSGLALAVIGVLISSVEWHVSHEGTIRISPVTRFLFDLRTRLAGRKTAGPGDLGGSVADW